MQLQGAVLQLVLQQCTLVTAANGDGWWARLTGWHARKDEADIMETRVEFCELEVR